MRRMVPVWVALAAVVVASCSYRPAVIDTTDAPLPESTKIYADNGQTLLITLAGDENRESISLDALPEHVTDAVVAIEDARFWSHSGVDARAILRAAVADVSEGEAAQGGSTITQQYVKQARNEAEKTIGRKVEDAILAVQLERQLSKRQILERYLNTIYFGNGASGIQAAAQRYFGVDAKDLSVAQAATLAGFIHAPSSYDVYNRPDEAVARRNLVVDRMLELGWLDPSSSAVAKAEALAPTVASQGDRTQAAYFVENVKKQILDDETFGATRQEREQKLFQGGLRIYTTLDTTKQRYAEDAVNAGRPDGTYPDASLVSLEPGTGYVRALVGGRDFYAADDPVAKVDLAGYASEPDGRRPTGSAFKPLVLAAALDQGIPLSKVYTAPSEMDVQFPGQVYHVANNANESIAGGAANLREAMVHSLNVVFVQLMRDVTPEKAVDMAYRLGITSELNAYPSAVLGTQLVHPIEMASAYGTFANGGYQVDPTFITKVTDADGTVVWEHSVQTTQAVSTEIANTITDVLSDVVTRGTGTAARIGRPVAGKTGTGQEFRDAYFVGYTPELVTSVWYGYATEGQRSMAPPNTAYRVYGGTWPAETWQRYMSAALADTPVTEFPEVSQREIDDASGTPPRSVDTDLPLVPNVVGVPATEAEGRLQRAGYLTVRQEEANNEYPPGYVIRQSPGGDARLGAGATVTIVVSTTGGAPAVTVANVIGAAEAAATATLQGQGLVVSVQRGPATNSGASVGAGAVWQQQPTADTQVAPGATVTIWINSS